MSRFSLNFEGIKPSPHGDGAPKIPREGRETPVHKSFVQAEFSRSAQSFEGFSEEFNSEFNTLVISINDGLVRQLSSTPGLNFIFAGAPHVQLGQLEAYLGVLSNDYKIECGSFYEEITNFKDKFHDELVQQEANINYELT